MPIRTVGVMLKKSMSVLSIVNAFLWLPAQAQAASCNDTVTSMSFTYFPLNPTPSDGEAGITLECTDTGGTGEEIAYTISLGTGSSGSYIARSFVGQPLEYNLYRDAGRSEVWGDGTENSQTVSSSLTVPANGTNSAIHAVYGRIPPMQNPSPETVTDRVEVNIVFLP